MLNINDSIGTLRNTCVESTTLLGRHMIVALALAATERSPAVVAMMR